MKVLSIIGFSISCLVFLIALYLQFVIAPAAALFESAMDSEHGSALDMMMNYGALDAKVNTGETVLVGAGITLLMCVFGFIKSKNKLGLVGIILSVISLVIGLIHGTHMFS